MDPDRKRKKEDENLSLGLGIAAGIVGAGLLGFGIYKLWDYNKKKEENSLYTEASEFSAKPCHALAYDFERSDCVDRRRQLELPTASRFSAIAPQECLSIGDIGVNFNEWKIPREISMSELSMATQFCDASESELNFSETDWQKATKAVDKVLEMLMREIRTEADKIEGLVIENYVKQGSSREGLKVHEADEFDVLLQYHFEGLDYEIEHISSGNNVLPELGYLRVNSTKERLSQTHPKLYRKDVFFEMNGQTYINSRYLQEKVFTSLVAKASSTVQNKVNRDENREKFDFKIKTRNNPPSVNIGIELTDDEDFSLIHHLGEIELESLRRGRDLQKLPSRKTTIIDVDIVPGLLLYEDRVPDPTKRGWTMSCPVYAVFKWLTENHRSASRYGAVPALLWRVCSSGYEKHVMDVAQGKFQQRHIINALRFLKLYFRNMKKLQPPPQVVTVLRSYHLKHIAFYCILFLRVLNNVQISDVETAVAYMLAFLKVCLDERKLPHFFQANENIKEMFPDFSFKPRSLRYDLFQGKDGESFNQAMRSFREMERKMATVIMRSSRGEMENLVTDYYVDIFRNYVSRGEYYK